jgi:hypothetical protein
VGLAWRFVRWLLSEHPRLREVAESEFRGAFAELAQLREAPVAPGELSRFGVLCGAERRAVRRTALEAVIGPCVVSLLAQSAERLSATRRAASVPRASDSAVRS